MRAPSIAQLLLSHWQAEPAVLSVAVAGCALYLWALRRARGRRHWLRAPAFLAGVAVTVLALDSGIGYYDDELLTVHMVQHVLLLDVAPVLLLAGDPIGLALRTLPASPRRRVARALVRASGVLRWWVCLLVYALVVVGTHLPPFFDAALRHPALHATEHGLYLLGGLLVWWPLHGSEPSARRRLGGLGRLLYMLAAMQPMAAIGAWLNRDPSIAYHPYAAPAHALGISAVTNQQQAGAIMWVGGSVIMLVGGLLSVLAAMQAEERRQAARDRYSATAGVQL